MPGGNSCPNIVGLVVSLGVTSLEWYYNLPLSKWLWVCHGLQWWN